MSEHAPPRLPAVPGGEPPAHPHGQEPSGKTRLSIYLVHVFVLLVLVLLILLVLLTPNPETRHRRRPSRLARVHMPTVHTARRILSASPPRREKKIMSTTRWNSVLGQSLEDLQHEAQLAQARNTHLALAMRTTLARVQETPHLALATATLLARVKKTSPQALAQEELLARVQNSPPQALALEELQARVHDAPPLSKKVGTLPAGVRHNGVENQLVADPRVPLDPHLRSRLLNRSRPHLRERSVLCPWAVVLLVDLSLSGLGACLLAPWSGVLSVHIVERVVRRCYQGHSERQLLVTPVHPQPSLPSSLRSANRGLRARVHHHKKSHSNGKADLRKDAWWWWWWCGRVLHVHVYPYTCTRAAN